MPHDIVPHTKKENTQNVLKNLLIKFTNSEMSSQKGEVCYISLTLHFLGQYFTPTINMIVPNQTLIKVYFKEFY